MMRWERPTKKRVHEEGVRPSLLTLAGHKGKRLRKGGVGPEMRSPVGLTGKNLPVTSDSVKVVVAFASARRELRR